MYSFMQVYGFPMNFAYAPIPDILERVKAKGIHNLLGTDSDIDFGGPASVIRETRPMGDIRSTSNNLQFALAVYVKAYSGPVLSIWIYLAALWRHAHVPWICSNSSCLYQHCLTAGTYCINRNIDRHLVCWFHLRTLEEVFRLVLYSAASDYCHFCLSFVHFIQLYHLFHWNCVNHFDSTIPSVCAGVRCETYCWLFVVQKCNSRSIINIVNTSVSSRYK